MMPSSYSIRPGYLLVDVSFDASEILESMGINAPYVDNGEIPTFCGLVLESNNSEILLGDIVLWGGEEKELQNRGLFLVLKVNEGGYDEEGGIYYGLSPVIVAIHESLIGMVIIPEREEIEEEEDEPTENSEES